MQTTDCLSQLDVCQISVIIPTYNRLGLLAKLIESWREVHTNTKFNYEIIFSDDGSEDESVQFLESVKDLPIRIIRNTHNGAASARNAAIRAAIGDRLLFIGDDIFPDPEILNKHLSFGQQVGPMTSTLGGVTWHPDLYVNHLMRHITEIGNEQFGYNQLKPGQYVDFKHFYTCNICVPGHFFRKGNFFFDERFEGCNFEDTELGYRLSLQGMRIKYIPNATGEHYHSYTVEGFCRRQISAGRNAVIFASIHPSVTHAIGVKKYSCYVTNDESLWQRRVNKLVQRCQFYENILDLMPEFVSLGMRDCLSSLYLCLFRSMYECGMLQKNTECLSPLANAMASNFRVWEDHDWDLFETDPVWLGLPTDKAYDLGEAINARNPEGLLCDSKQYVLFDEFIRLRALGQRKWSLATMPEMVNRKIVFLLRDPSRFAARSKQILSRSMATLSHMTLKIIKDEGVINFLSPIPGLVLDPQSNENDSIILAYRNIFGDALKIYEYVQASSTLIELDLDSPHKADPIDPTYATASIFFWPTTTKNFKPDHVLSAYMALVENGLDIVIVSNALDAVPNVTLSNLRDHLVFSRNIAKSIFNENFNETNLVGKVIRLLPSPSQANSHNLNQLLGCQLKINSSGFFRNRSGYDKRTKVRHKPPYLPDYPKDKPVIFVFPIFLAVGGVERNMIEVIRQLQDQFDFIIITMERLVAEQGSLAGQALEVATHVIEMAELVNPSDYLRVLSRLKSAFKPDLVWVCNGSPWFCDNALEIRAIFRDIPIVDQEVYDVKQGWISRYKEPGIQSFDQFIAINKKIRDRFTKDLNIHQNRVHLIYHAIDSDRIKYYKGLTSNFEKIRDELDLPHDKRLFTFVARLSLQKRPLQFLELALRRRNHDNEFFIMVGDGPLAQEVITFINRHNLHNVKRIPYTEKILLLASVSSGIIFTSAYEGLPIAMLEAIAMGVPCFSTDVGDIADVLHEYGGGEVVPVNSDAEDFAVAFDKWLLKLDIYASNLIKNSGAILDRFSSKNIAKQYDLCWQSLMEDYKKMQTK